MQRNLTQRNAELSQAKLEKTHVAYSSTVWNVLPGHGI